MTIKTYELSELTVIVAGVFPPKPCEGWYCKYNVSSLSEFYRLSNGLMSGNNYAFKTFKNIGKGNKYGEGEGESNLDTLSPSQFLYYNNNIKEY
jgi:hypothetical protein